MPTKPIQHGLIQKALLDAKSQPYTIEGGHGTWTVWRLSPGTRSGKVWAADFIDPLQAEDFIVSQCPPPEDHIPERSNARGSPHRL